MKHIVSRIKFANVLCLMAIVISCAFVRPQELTAAVPTGDRIIILVPQFTAEAVSFRAIDESGWDAAGSDEVYAFFSDGSPNDLITATYEDVDTGETRTFGPQERCITPRPACDRGFSEIPASLSSMPRTTHRSRSPMSSI